MVIEIQKWDWPLAVGAKPIPSREFDPGGPLMCVRSISVEGLVVEPEAHRSKRILLLLMPLPREIILGDPEARYVGSLYEPPVKVGFNLGATLFLTEDTLQQVVFCLSSIWRQAHLWIDDEAEPHGVTDYDFSSDTRAVSTQANDAT